MPLVNIVRDASQSEFIPELAALGDVVTILIKGHRLPRRRVKELEAYGHVLEYLNSATGIAGIAADVLSKLGHEIHAKGGPLVMLNGILSATQVADIMHDLDSVNMVARLGSSGRPEVVAFSATIAENPLLPRFFNMLKELGIKDERGLELLEQTFGGRGA